MPANASLRGCQAKRLAVILELLAQDDRAFFPQTHADRMRVCFGEVPGIADQTIGQLQMHYRFRRARVWNFGLQGTGKLSYSSVKAEPGGKHSFCAVGGDQIAAFHPTLSRDDSPAFVPGYNRSDGELVG